MNIVKSKLIDFSVYKKDDVYNIKAVYEITDEHGNIYQNIIEDLPIYIAHKCSVNRAVNDSYNIGETFVDLGFASLLASKNTKITTKLVTKAVKKMTVAEIEKELGYAIEIISDKEEKTDGSSKEM